VLKMTRWGVDLGARALLHILPLAAVLSVAIDAQAVIPGISGVRLGAVTSTSVKVLTSDATSVNDEQEPALMEVFISPAGQESWVSKGSCPLLMESNYGGVVEVTGLSPDTVYEYRVDLADDDGIVTGTRSGSAANYLRGSFKTAPASHQPFKFLWRTCWGLGLSRETWPHPELTALNGAAMKVVANRLQVDPGEYLFGLWLGDFIYHDQWSANLDRPPYDGSGQTWNHFAVSDFRDAYRNLFWRAQQYMNYPSAIQRVWSNLPGEYMWDDHEFGGRVGDWDRGCVSGPPAPGNDVGGSYPNGRKVIVEEFMGANRAVPTGTDCVAGPDDIAYYTWTIGDAQFWMLDTRSWRDDNYAGSTVLGDGLNKARGWTGTQPNQLAWFISSIGSSMARFKVILTSVAFGREGHSHVGDNWMSAPEERTTVLHAIEAASGLKVSLTGDWHTNAMYWTDNGGEVLEAVAGRAAQATTPLNPDEMTQFIWKELSNGTGIPWPSGVAQQLAIGVVEVRNRSMTIYHLGQDGTTGPKMHLVDARAPCLDVGVDSDGDGFGDDCDDCALVTDDDQLDTDLDGLGDACDPDDDNDGLPDGSDAFPLDTDNDGLDNDVDPDDDNDGILDENDPYPLDPNNGAVGSGTDTDGDGLPDTTDPLPFDYNYADGDLDGSGSMNVADVLLAVQIAGGLRTPNTVHLQHGDVTPIGAPDGRIDVSDTVVVMRKAFNLPSD